MKKYIVTIKYRNFDARTGHVENFTKTMEIAADDEHTAKAIGWQSVLGEYPYCHFVDWSAI